MSYFLDQVHSAINNLKALNLKQCEPAQSLLYVLILLNLAVLSVCPNPLCFSHPPGFHSLRPCGMWQEKFEHWSDYTLILCVTHLLQAAGLQSKCNSCHSSDMFPISVCQCDLFSWFNSCSSQASVTVCFYITLPFWQFKMYITTK